MSDNATITHKSRNISSAGIGAKSVPSMSENPSAAKEIANAATQRHVAIPFAHDTPVVEVSIGVGDHVSPVTQNAPLPVTSKRATPFVMIVYR